MPDSQPKPSRRGFVFGVATAGAATAAVVALPHVQHEEAQAPALKPVPANGGGYQLTEHVKRYYQTTLV
ncbi:MAG: twin-arginine translocation signal domain-containing protein [Haliea sp.]|nr:MAG: twin-arginine translocation signal domain-containing protein [Haliea sp.]